MIHKALKIICLGILVLLLGIPSLAQNTKGDKPAPSGRESRFKTPKKSQKKVKSGRRIKQKSDKPGKRAGGPPSRARGGDRPGKRITPNYSKTGSPGKQKPWKGDITRRRIKPRSSASRAWNVYPQPPTTNYSSESRQRNVRRNDNPNVKRVRRMQQEESSKVRVGRPIRPVFSKSRPPNRERPWRGDLTGRRIRAGTSHKINNPLVGNAPRMDGARRTRVQKAPTVPSRIRGRAKNVYSDKSFYVNNKSHKPPRYQSPANQRALGMLKRYDGQDKPRVKNRKIVPRSASASYISRRSINTWAHFSKPKRRQGVTTKDLAGHKLRSRNYETKRPVLTNPTLNYQRRVAVGERPYKGPAAGGYITRTRSGQRAWRGDIARWPLRGGKARGEKAFLGFLKGGGFRSATQPGGLKAGTPVRRRVPGKGAERIGKYQGNIKTNQQRGFENQGEEFTGTIKANRRRGFGDQGEEYSGNIKARRLLKGGGSVSGKLWNNKGTPIQGKTPGKGAGRIAYQGNIRAGKRGFNDQGEEYSGNIKENERRGFSDQGEEYTGNIKARRPDKGGGSRSGQHWNNNNTAIQVRVPKEKSARIAGYQGNLKAGKKAFGDQGEEYSGNIKARRPDKGGGSVSGKLWNNEERPIPVKNYSSQVTKVSRFSGSFKTKRPEKGGESVSGKFWNNDEKAIAVRAPKSMGERNFSGTVKISRNHYSKKPKAADVAMRGEKASAAALKADQFSRGTRRDWDYVKNPSSADGSQRTREPGRAFARSGEYQGNIKMKKFDLFGKRNRELHPDARFVKLNKNNVPEEKDMFTNFKLWWARLFKKSETQPDHLKEKGHKPRYDKGESRLWYE
ncbi:MAG: hypothetical protein WD824_18205 [Cyclobacteriaceae bacterium]